MLFYFFDTKMQQKPGSWFANINPLFAKFK